MMALVGPRILERARPKEHNEVRTATTCHAGKHACKHQFSKRLCSRLLCAVRAFRNLKLRQSPFAVNGDGAQSAFAASVGTLNSQDSGLWLEEDLGREDQRDCVRKVRSASFGREKLKASQHSKCVVRCALLVATG